LILRDLTVEIFKTSHDAPDSNGYILSSHGESAVYITDTGYINIRNHNKLKNPRIADPKKMVFIVDHNVPSDSAKTAASQKKMRDFAREHGIDFWEGKGVCHQIMMEHYVCPRELIFGADSHTCTYGALGAFGTGVGCTDLLYGMVTGTSWVLVPETVRFYLTGELKEGVYHRDLMLSVIGEIGASGVDSSLRSRSDCPRLAGSQGPQTKGSVPE